MESLCVESDQTLVEHIIVGLVRVDGALEGHPRHHLWVYITDRSVLENQPAIHITHSFGLSIELVRLTFEDLGWWDSPLPCILLKLLLLLLKLEQVLAVVQDGLTELIAEITVDKGFEIGRDFLASFPLVEFVLVLLEHILDLVLDIV